MAFIKIVCLNGDDEMISHETGRNSVFHIKPRLRKQLLLFR